MTIDELHPYSEIHLPARRKRRVPNWSRPSAPKSIRQLMDERAWAYGIEATDPTPRNRAAARAAEDALFEGQWPAATEFGGPHLWRPAKRSFAFDALAGFCNSKRRFRHLFPPLELMDHNWCFRWAHGRGPAAIVAQPYKPAFDLAKAVEFARENELEVSVAEFESWHFPGKCTLVVWTRGVLGGSGVGHNCWMTPAVEA